MEKHHEHPYSISELVHTQVGNIPVILTSPHGGKLPLGSVKVRTSPGSCIIKDSNTNMIVEKVNHYLQVNHHGLKPYIVKGLASRKFCDLNRAPCIFYFFVACHMLRFSSSKFFVHNFPLFIFIAHAYDDEEAKAYYDAYHNAIKHCIKEMKEKFPDKLPLLLGKDLFALST